MSYYFSTELTTLPENKFLWKIYYPSEETCTFSAAEIHAEPSEDCKIFDTSGIRALLRKSIHVHGFEFLVRPDSLIQGLRLPKQHPARVALVVFKITDRHHDYAYLLGISKNKLVALPRTVVLP